MNTDIIICTCHSPEHQILFRHNKEWEEIYIEIHLQEYSFFKKLKYAIKYLLGHKSDYGAWDEIVLKKKELKNILSKID